MKMKSVCPMVCQKNENVLYTPRKPANKTFYTPFNKPPATNPRQPLLQTLSKAPCKPFSNPLAPLRGLHSLHLNKSKRGEYNQRLRLSKPTFYIQIKGFPRNITKHTKRRRPGHSTNPCGKPSAFSPFPACPLEGAYTLTHLIKL